MWPVPEHVLCLFAQYLAYTFHSIAAIRNYIAGIRKIHILLKTTPPAANDIEVKMTMLGLAKKMKRGVKQAFPLTPDIMLDMVPFLNLKKRFDLMFWGILVVGFFTFFRKSNLIPDGLHKFDHKKQLSRNAVSFEQNVAIVGVTWSKTIQFRNKLLEVPLFQIPNSPLCPVTVLRALLSLPGKKHHPLFALRGGIPFTYAQFQRKFKQTLKLAGYNSSLFSSHSMRRGGCAFAHRSGVSESLLQVQGDWASQSFKRYLNFPIEIRAAVNLKMRERIMNTVIHF